MKKAAAFLLIAAPLAYLMLRPRDAQAAALGPMYPTAQPVYSPSLQSYGTAQIDYSGFDAVGDFFGNLFASDPIPPPPAPAPVTFPAWEWSAPAPSAPTPTTEPSSGYSFDWWGAGDDSWWTFDDSPAAPAPAPVDSMASVWESLDWSGTGDDSWWYYEAPGVSQMNADANLNAFLRMIRDAEHSGLPYPDADRYRAMFGGEFFASFADHPRQRFAFTQTDGKTNYTTAAGAYQFIAPTWDALRARLGLPDFSPPSQDAAAVELIRERGALADVQAGRFDEAVMKLGRIWASLPTSTAPQHTRSWDFVRQAYVSAGGDFA